MGALRINNIWPDDAMCDGSGNGMAIGVDLNNRSTIILSLDTLADKPLFYDIVRGKYKGNYDESHTDGYRVYWENGASLTIEEMLDLLKIGKIEEVYP